MKLHTEVVNGIPITLPLGLDYRPEERRDDYTSYLSEEKGFKEVNHHLKALTTLLARNVQPNTQRVLHAFGGLGATAQVVRHMAPNSIHTFWERSLSCVDYLKKEWDDVHHVEDSFKKFMETNLAVYDLVIFDPSLGSILSPGIVEAWGHMSHFPRIKVWVSDMATSKIHLNGKAYARVFREPVWSAEAYAFEYDQFLRQRGKRIIGATRDSFEMYFMVGPKGKGATKPFIVERLT